MPADHPPIHVLDIGDYGAGKSTFAASFPNPKIVLFFDSYGKEMPYIQLAQAKGQAVSEIETWDDGIPRRCIYSKRDPNKILVQIEFYHDDEFIEPNTYKRKAGTMMQDVKPTAYEKFLGRMHRFQYEQAAWKTVVLDSVTMMEIAARQWDQFVLNPNAEDARQWYGASKSMLERMLLGRFGQIKQNVVVLAHIDDEKFEFHGKQRRGPLAPGKLRASLGSQYTEVYHQYAVDGQFALQTRSDNLFACMSAIKAPNPCYPHYRALWNEEVPVDEVPAA